MQNSKNRSTFVLGIIVLFLITCVTLLVGCTPHKRMARLIKNNPELLTATDTIKFTDTIHFQTERVYRDSVFLLSDARRDTVIIKEKNLTVRTFVYGDTIYVDGECDTIRDTIIKNHSVPYPVVEYNEKSFRTDEILLIITIVLWSFLVLLYYLIRYFKNRSRFS